MYKIQFLKDEGKLRIETKEYIQKVVEESYTDINKILNIDECEIYFITSTKKVMEKEFFQESVCDNDVLYMFVDEKVNETINKDEDIVRKKLINHLLGGLYSLSRVRKLSLGADCGLLEEIINEGLSASFISERNEGDIPDYYTQIPKEKMDMFLKKIKAECSSGEEEIEKWFTGKEEEGIPKLAALSIGFYLTQNFLKKFNKKTLDLIDIPSKNIANL